MIHKDSETSDLIANDDTGVKDLYDSGSATLKHRPRCLNMACYGDSIRKGLPNASEAEAHTQILIASRICQRAPIE